MAIKVFKLDDYEWWAGESLEACIAAARSEAGMDCYEDAETDGYEVTAEDMQTHKFTEEDGVTQISFAEHLQELIEAPTEFPVLFAATEW
jgi:hypothetical protein